MDGFSFLKKYSTRYILLKNLVASKTSINTVNDDENDIVFDLMKAYNVSSFFKKSGIINWNLYEKSKLKALNILLKCEKRTEGIKKFLPKGFKKDVKENQKIFLLNAMMLFDIINTIASLFKYGFVKPLGHQNTVKLEQKPIPEQSVGEMTKLRRQA